MWALSTIPSFTASLGLPAAWGGLHAVSLLTALAGLAHWLYTRMDSFVLRRWGARRLYFEEAPRLYERVAHLSIAARIPCPRLYVVRRPVPNAFSLGTSPRTSSIILTSAALNALSEAELCAMIAHELAHIVHGDTRRATLVAALAALRARKGKAWEGVTSRRGRAWLQGLGTPPESDLAADRTAAWLLGGSLGLAALLARLKECTPSTEVISGASLDERIRQLRKLAVEEKARRAMAVLRRSPRRGSRFYPRSGARHRPTSGHPQFHRKRLSGTWSLRAAGAVCARHSLRSPPRDARAPGPPWPEGAHAGYARGRQVCPASPHRAAGPQGGCLEGFRRPPVRVEAR